MAATKLSSADIVKFGPLFKRSQNKGRFTAENYKRRFFVLSKYYFKYYDGNSDVSVAPAKCNDSDSRFDWNSRF